MQRLLLTVSALAALATPGLLLAQAPPQDARQDTRQDNRDNRGDMRQDNRDHRGDVRQDNRDHRADARQDQRQDMRARVYNRNDRNWYRGRPEFNGYNGVRPGQWFIPGRGYIRPDPRFYNYTWRIGGFVPFGLRGYYVTDPYVYGLPRAPYSFRYVFLGNTVALINVRNGRIVRTYPNLF
ncbi:MAG: RcnB family protein [Caulobacteraceae bacterium]